MGLQPPLRGAATVSATVPSSLILQQTGMATACPGLGLGLRLVRELGVGLALGVVLGSAMATAWLIAATIESSRPRRSGRSMYAPKPPSSAPGSGQPRLRSTAAQCGSA